jgi:hypothetical protein
MMLLVFSSQGAAQIETAPKPDQPAVMDQPKTKMQEEPPSRTSLPRVSMPDAEKIVLLVRNTLITLNDAIQTGNFTVLRDRGAPAFREANSAGRLSQIFSDLTSRGVDLSVVSVATPQLTRSPILDRTKGSLNIKGYFSAPPVHIDFEILYHSVAGHWRLFGLSVQVPKGNGTAPDK